MKQTARQTEAYDLAKGTLGREGEVGRLASQAQSIVATDSQTSLRMAESRHRSTAARGTSVCRTFTIAHVNAALLRKELDVVSVCLRTYHLCVFEPPGRG